MFVQWNAPFHPTSRWLFCSGESETERVGVRAMDVIFCFSPFGLSDFSKRWSQVVTVRLYPAKCFLLPPFIFSALVPVWKPASLPPTMHWFSIRSERGIFFKNWWRNKQSFTGCLWCINLKSVASQLPTSLAAFHPLYCHFPPSNQCCPLSAPSFQASLPKNLLMIGFKPSSLGGEILFRGRGIYFERQTEGREILLSWCWAYWLMFGQRHIPLSSGCP